jgi:NitT/TauT family transport system substrate-binding protein
MTIINRSLSINRRQWLHKAAQVAGLGTSAALGATAWAQLSGQPGGTPSTARAFSAATPGQPAGPPTSPSTGASTSQSTSTVGTQATAVKLEKRVLQIAVFNKAALPYLPLTVAEQLGYFAAEGLELEITEAPSMVRAQQLAAAGTADMVCGWVENTLALQVTGPQFMAFVLMGRAPQFALGISTKTMSAAKGLADLAGKKVGIIAPSTPSHTVAYAALSRAGVRLSEMGFVSVGTASGAVAALRSGQVDALCYSDPLITQLEQRGELRVLADTRTMRGTLQACGGDMPASCLYATPEFLQKHPGTTQAATHAIVHALKWLQTAGLSDLMKILPESYFAGDRALYLSAFARMRDAIAIDGMISADGVSNTLGAMRAAEPLLRAEAIDPARSFTNTFASKAKQRFKV